MIFARLTKDLLDLRIDDQVEVALAVADLGSVKASNVLPSLLLDDGQRADRLREHREAFAVYRQLAGVGAEGEALDADEVADVEQFLEDRIVERRVAFGADVVAADVNLDAARVVVQFEERGAAHDAARHDAAGDADVVVVVLRVVVVFGDFTRRGRHFVACGGIRLDAQVAQRFERLAAQLLLFAEFDCHVCSSFWFIA